MPYILEITLHHVGANNFSLIITSFPYTNEPVQTMTQFKRVTLTNLILNDSSIQGHVLLSGFQTSG